MNTKILPYLFLSAGAMLRLVGLTVSPFWYDEAYSVYLSRLPDLMIRLEFSDFNPPLWQMVVYPFIRIFGETELALRLPSLLASLAALWLAWMLAEELLPEPVHLPAAALLGLLPYHFWLAQDGRCYALMSMIYLLTLYMALKGRWIGFGACVGLLVYSHITGFFYAAAAGLGALAWRWEDRKRIILWGLVGGLSFLPWVPALFDQPSSHWLGSLTMNGLLGSLYQITFAADLPVIMAGMAAWVILISLVAGTIVSIARSGEPGQRTLALWAVGPLALLLLAATVKNLIFYRPLSAMLLPLCLWLAANLWPTRPAGLVAYALPYLWAVLLFAGLVFWTPGLKGGALRDVAREINRQWNPGDVVYHATGTSWLPFSLYLNEPGYLLDEEQHAGLLQTHLQDEFGVPRASLETIPHRRVWVVWARDVLMTTRAVERMKAYIHGGILVGRVHYWQAPDIEVYLVSK